MDAERYLKIKTPAFFDQKGTKFIKGPFLVEGRTYDYKLVDKDGIDFCTVAQMEDWYVDVVEKGMITPEDEEQRIKDE